MNDDQKAEAFASAIIEDESKLHGFKAGPHSGRLAEAFKKLRALGVSWGKILSLGLSVLAVLQGTGTWDEVWQKVLDLFKDAIPGPTPAVHLP